MTKSPINIKFRYIDDVLSINNSRFGDFVDHINPIELEIKETTDTGRSASYRNDKSLNIIHTTQWPMVQ
jgi:hypothetical protein